LDDSPREWILFLNADRDKLTIDSVMACTVYMYKVRRFLRYDG